MGMSIISSIKKRYLLILTLIAIITSVSSVSAIEIDFPMVTGKNIYDCEVVQTKNTSYVVVNLNEKVSFTASTYKINKLNWNFGDNAKLIETRPVNNVSTASHTYKKVGTYKVTVNVEGKSNNINLLNTEDFVTVKVVKKPDLVLTKLNYARKGKDIVGFQATVKNKGASSSKASTMKMWYADPKFKKYTKSIKIPALKSGQSASVIIAFQIPYKFRKQIKFVKVDSANQIDESIKSNNQKRLNDLIMIK